MTKLNEASKAKFSAFIPREFAPEVIIDGPPAEGDVVEMVCVYANPDDGYGIQFRVKSTK